MKARWNKIKTGLLILIFVVIGVVEYVQLMMYFDLPQAILVMPVLGALSYISLKKIGLFVPVLTIILSCIVQIVAGGENVLYQLKVDGMSVTKIILQILPLLIVLEFIGIAGGVLIRVIMNKKKQMGISIAALILGILLIVLPYGITYKNPVYPISSRIKLMNYVANEVTDYVILSKEVYFDLNESSYCCKVTMADGVQRFFYLDESGNVVPGTN